MEHVDLVAHAVGLVGDMGPDCNLCCRILDLAVVDLVAGDIRAAVLEAHSDDFAVAYNPAAEEDKGFELVPQVGHYRAAEHLDPFRYTDQMKRIDDVGQQARSGCRGTPGERYYNKPAYCLPFWPHSYLCRMYLKERSRVCSCRLSVSNLAKRILLRHLTNCY